MKYPLQEVRNSLLQGKYQQNGRKSAEHIVAAAISEASMKHLSQ